MNLLLTIKSIIPYLNGNYKDFGPKRMQNDRYLILLYGATMIDEFKQRGTKHGKLLYFSYNQLKKISNSPLFNPPGPLMFENSRTARHKVYPSLRAKKWVRIKRINVESYNGAECVAITKKGTHIAIKRVNEIGNGFSMDANAWFHKGVALAKSEKYPESLHCYTTAIQIDPNLTLAWYQKGYSLNQLGNYDKAIECLDKALQIDPNLASAWNCKGHSLTNLENYDKAIECLNTALQIDPNLAEAWDNKAWALGNLKDYDESIRCIDRALQINPNFATAWYRKGWTLKKLGKYDEAEQYIDKSRQLGYEG